MGEGVPSHRHQPRLGRGAEGPAVSVSGHPDRLARFEREAKVLASLNHPNSVRGTGSANRLDVIIDVSNSMWGQIGGRPKIELAREALQGALHDLPPDVAVGLRAYGHRVSVENRNAGCADTERLLIPAPENGSAIVGISCALGFSWTLDCERVLAGGVSR